MVASSPFGWDHAGDGAGRQFLPAPLVSVSLDVTGLTVSGFYGNPMTGVGGAALAVPPSQIAQQGHLRRA